MSAGLKAGLVGAAVAVLLSLFSQTQGGCGLHLITSGMLSRAGPRRACHPAASYPDSESVTGQELGLILLSAACCQLRVIVREALGHRSR